MALEIFSHLIERFRSGRVLRNRSEFLILGALAVAAGLVLRSARSPRRCWKAIPPPSTATSFGTPQPCRPVRPPGTAVARGGGARSHGAWKLFRAQPRGRRGRRLSPDGSQAAGGCMAACDPSSAGRRSAPSSRSGSTGPARYRGACNACLHDELPERPCGALRRRLPDARRSPGRASLPRTGSGSTFYSLPFSSPSSSNHPRLSRGPLSDGCPGRLVLWRRLGDPLLSRLVPRERPKRRCRCRHARPMKVTAIINAGAGAVAGSDKEPLRPSLGSAFARYGIEAELALVKGSRDQGNCGAGARKGTATQDRCSRCRRR